MARIIKRIPCGELAGESYEGINRYLGIKYAEAERFAYPKEITKWEGVYEATDFGPAPIQDSTYHKKDCKDPANHYEHEFMLGVDPSYSEDCLYLNIWTPEKAEKAPVLIVIYGGGLVSGMSQSLEFDGDEFARRGIVTVTFNYRVNVFGFMYLDLLKDKNGKAGNYGYYDQQTAIEWVRHNIKALGGDVDNMTIIGQSAGAASAETQIKSPLNKGYFKQAIIQSSAGFSTVLKSKDNRTEENKKWNEVFLRSGVGDIGELKTMPAEKLYETFKEVSSKKPIAFCNAVYDDYFVGDFRNEPVDTKIMYSITSEDVMPFILNIVGAMLSKSQAKLTDTYAYYFCRRLPGDDLGAWHSSDLMYVYSTLSRSWRPFTKEDHELSKKMIGYLQAFIKTGNPNHQGAPEWKTYNGSKKYMSFDVEEIGMRKIPILHLLKETLFGKNIGFK
ncbi:MAG: carboxylesterase family protein [Erysipelotrichaceae bacterium]|nr:carboxylesterase family protein [Erysipelotrichaceae bacterium]